VLLLELPVFPLLTEEPDDVDVELPAVELPAVTVGVAEAPDDFPVEDVPVDEEPVEDASVVFDLALSVAAVAFCAS
jgi:hypothetical protein